MVGTLWLSISKPIKNEGEVGRTSRIHFIYLLEVMKQNVYCLCPLNVNLPEVEITVRGESRLCGWNCV